MVPSNDTPTHKIVNGEEVELTEEEKTAIKQGWDDASESDFTDYALLRSIRQNKIQQVNDYMYSLVLCNELEQSSYDSFMDDTYVHRQNFIEGTTRFITWVKTINENGYNATLTGFKMHPEYRGENTGTLLNPVYPRADHLISILQS